MARKEYRYRGKSLEELQAMSTEEFMELLPSRERRTLKRGTDDSKKSVIARLEKKDKAKTHSREMIVLPMMVGKIVAVHTGKEFVEVHIIPEMIGMRLGQLALTRRKVSHSSPGVGSTKSKGSVSVR
jgi:small subunit ribosomal protein S19